MLCHWHWRLRLAIEIGDKYHMLCSKLRESRFFAGRLAAIHQHQFLPFQPLATYHTLSANNNDSKKSRSSPTKHRPTTMRLLTHNVLRNNTKAANGSNAPLRITATEVRVDEPTTNNDPDAQRREIEFAKNMLPALNWDTLIEGAKSMGLDSLPPSVTPELANDEGFLRALYHVLMDVHLVNGMLTCTETGREFAVTNGIANFMLEEDECEVPK